MNAVFLTEVCLVNTVDLGERDTLFLQFGSSLLVMGSESLAMTAPAGRAEALVISLHFREAKGDYHGAKNSRRTRGSLVIASKLLGVTSMTSEASSAIATVTRARAVRERRREENFMTTGGREGECDETQQCLFATYMGQITCNRSRRGISYVVASRPHMTITHLAADKAYK